MKIPPNISEWLNLLARWIHVFAGILWVGTTYFFTWLDGRFHDAPHGAGDDGKVWMVHSGGFYVVEKRTGLELERVLHWFRWEAAITWLSGFFLLVLLYYMGGGLLDPDSPGLFVPGLGIIWRGVGVTEGTLIGLGALVVAWLVYDLMHLTPLGKNEMGFAVVSYILVVAAAYGLSRVLSGRAAYIHIGAMFGTIMAANVWMRILPAQRKMIAALKEGREPDAALSAQAKLRSKQNTFMAVPVVFTMISNHFPVATYGHDYNWVVLSVLILLGWGAAKLIRRA
ncbi:MAG: urate hydroxylase PuuD [Acidobacteria bacterium]|nr:urate hydroxylase PuuD [Acidobacteriota bacterium]